MAMRANVCTSQQHVEKAVRIVCGARMKVVVQSPACSVFGPLRYLFKKILVYKLNGHRCTGRSNFCAMTSPPSVTSTGTSPVGASLGTITLN